MFVTGEVAGLVLIKLRVTRIQVRVPFRKGDTDASRLEPYTEAYPQYGRGNQIQLHADDRLIEFNDVRVLPE